MRSFGTVVRDGIQRLLNRIDRKCQSHAARGGLPTWRTLYLAAVFESDQGQMVRRIADARRASVERARELFCMEGDHLQEESEIDDALLALQALERSVLHL